MPISHYRAVRERCSPCRASWPLTAASADKVLTTSAIPFYDYNVPLALPPYGYSPSFWGYGGRRYYDRFGNYKKYGQEPGEPDTGPVD